MKTGILLVLAILLLPFPLGADLPEHTDILLLEESLVRHRLDVADAKARRWPRIDLDFNATWMSNPPIGPIEITDYDLALMSPLITSTPSAIPPSGVTFPLYAGMGNTAYDFKITLSQPIFTWGKINASVDLAEAMLEAKGFELQEKRREIATEITLRSNTVVRLKEMAKILEEQLVLGNELVAIVQSSFEEGLVLELEVAKTALELHEIELAMLETNYNIETQLVELEDLHGVPIPLETLEAPFAEEKMKQLVDTPLEVLLEQAIASDTPVIAAMMRLQQAADASERIAKGSFYGKPDLALVVSAGYSSSQFPFVGTTGFTLDDFAFTVSVGIKSTLWDGGTLLNSIKRAASRTSEAQLETVAVRNDIGKRLKEAHLSLRTTLRKLALQREKSATLQQKANLQKEMVSQGYVSEQTSITAQMEFIASKIEEKRLEIDAERSYLGIMHMIE